MQAVKKTETPSYQVFPGHVFKTDIHIWTNHLDAFDQESTLLLDILGWKYVMQDIADREYDVKLKQFRSQYFPGLRHTISTLEQLLVHGDHHREFSLPYVHDIYQRLKIQMEKTAMEFTRLKIAVLHHIRDTYPLQIL